jgi:hypothetical protein
MRMHMHQASQNALQHHSVHIFWYQALEIGPHHLKRLLAPLQDQAPEPGANKRTRTAGKLIVDPTSDTYNVLAIFGQHGLVRQLCPSTNFVDMCFQKLRRHENSRPGAFSTISLQDNSCEGS